MCQLLKRPIEVQDREGGTTPAELAVCSCGCEGFHLYTIKTGEARHMHYQCLDCGVSYCTGEGICGEDIHHGRR